MTCHIKPTMTLAHAMARAQRFGPTTLVNLSNPAGGHQRKGIDVSFPSCKLAKKVSFTYKSRQPSGSTRKLENTYHRFCLFQIVNSSDVVRLFTKTEIQSFVLFQYLKDIRPGVAVSILHPKIEGSFNTSNNFLI